MKAVVFGGVKAMGYGTRRHSGKPWTPQMGGGGTNLVGHSGNRGADGTVYLMANKRSVWEIPTHGYKDAHFAVFPEALVEPCIRAGSQPGGVILDPFCGSGTTGVVALKLGRSFLGLELNPQYVEMARQRIGGVMPLFA